MSTNIVHHLYLDHHRWLFNWLNRKLGDSADAADIAQDTFIRIIHTPTNENVVADAINEPRAYLTVVAKRLVANLYRRRVLEKAYLDSLAQFPMTAAPSLEHQQLILETLQKIDSLLDELPPKVRDAFLLSQLDGLTYAQVAMQLNVSERSVKRYMVQAMAKCILLMP
jgi:RNA polymerase sigma factor (sigma-70 family)